jgi:hypothetical protein
MYSPNIAFLIFYKRQYIASGFLLLYCLEAKIALKQILGCELLNTTTHSGDIDIAFAGDESLQHVTGAKGGAVTMMVARSKETNLRRFRKMIAEGNKSRGAGEDNSSLAVMRDATYLIKCAERELLHLIACMDKTQ